MKTPRSQRVRREKAEFTPVPGIGNVDTLGRQCFNRLCKNVVS